MDSPCQPNLVDIPEQPLQQDRAPHGSVKLKSIDRRQTVLAQIYVEELIPAEHKARAIWDLVGRMDLNRFAETLRTTAGCAGRPAWDPQLMVSLWVYAYSEGISSAREIERLMEWEPGMQWLGGLQTVNHHSLSDFRIEHRAALDELFAQLLALLAQAGLVDLQQVMHDGTKIRAVTGADTFRREKTIRERLEEARQAVAQFGDPRAEARQSAARERAARERKQRMEAALEELTGLQVEKNLGEKPAQVVVDGGFTNRDNIVDCAAQKIDLVGSLARPEERSEAAMKSQGIDPAFAPHHFCILEAGQQLQCLAGCTLPYVRQSRKRGNVYQQYQARGEDCLACRYRPQCCPKTAEKGRTVSIRVEEQADVAAFCEKMD